MNKYKSIKFTNNILNHIIFIPIKCIMDKTTISYLLLATIVALFPPILIKKYNTDKYYDKYAFKWIIISVIMYIIMLFSYVKLFDNRDLGIYYVILQILQIIIMVPLGIMLFNESINSVKLFGILLAIISIFILSKYK